MSVCEARGGYRIFQEGEGGGGGGGGGGKLFSHLEWPYCQTN